MRRVAHDDEQAFAELVAALGPALLGFCWRTLGTAGCRIIRMAMKQLFPTEPKGNFARRWTTLAALVAGIVQARSCQLPAIARKTPDLAKADSRIKRYSRWVQNERIEIRRFYLPFVSELLAHLAEIRELVFVIDGSEVGHECITLMISLIYRKRALPITWLVVKGCKGHLPERVHLDLLTHCRLSCPKTLKWCFGRWEFDGISSSDLHSASLVYQRGLWPGHVIVMWERGCATSLYLVTNFELPDEALYWYKKRFQIENAERLALMPGNTIRNLASWPPPDAGGRRSRPLSA